MRDANQAHISLSIQGVASDLQVLAFEGREALNQPYLFSIDLVSQDPQLELEALLNQPAFLAFGPAGGGVHGLVYAIEQGDSGKRLTRYRISLQPQLAYLQHRYNQRIFQQLSVPQIIALLLEEHGIAQGAYRFQLGSVYPARDYCTQYDESDLHFIQRLCEEEGISFHFQHRANAHALVFGDDQTVFRKLPALNYQQDSGLAAEQAVVRAFNVRLATRSTQASYRDYDFEKPRLTLQATQSSAFQPSLEVYDFPGRFTERERGKHLDSWPGRWREEKPTHRQSRSMATWTH